MEKHATATPHIITAEDLLKKLRAGTKELHEIKMREMVIPVRVLSVDEMNAIRRDSIKQTALGMGDETDKNLTTQKTTLKMASTVSGVPLLGDKLLSMLSTDEINFIYNEYVKVMDDVNPNIEMMLPDQFKALVDALKKNLISTKDLSLHQLKAISTAFQDMIQRQDGPSSQTDS
jgi:hypothetical protein